MFFPKTDKKTVRNTFALTGGIFAFFFSFLTLHTLAAPDLEMTYHGKLTNTTNVSVSDGDYDFTLTIYDAPTGGNCVWTNSGDCLNRSPQTVTVSKGIFSTTLTDLDTLTFDQNYYLGVKIGTNTEMSPRRKITPTGFALNAHRVNGLEAAESGATAHIVATNSTGDLTVTGDILPQTDDDYTLGDSTHRWQDVYIGPNSLHIGTNGDEGIISYDTTNNVFNFNTAAIFGTTTNNVAGTIRYSGTDFEGYNGTSWSSLTSADDTVSGTELDATFTTTGILTRTGAATYVTIADNSANWNTAYGWGNHASAGYLSASAFTDGAVTSKLLTGFTTGTNTAITATDTILQAFQKTQGQINARQTTLTNSAGLANALSDETGTGLTVFATSPNLTTPNIGVATATSLNGLTLTSAADGFTLIGGTTARTLTVTGNNASVTGINTGDQTTITGNAGSATYASAVTLTADNSTNATNYPLFTNAATGNLSPRTDTGFTYNPGTGILTATGFVGALTGNVTGNVSGSAASFTGSLAGEVTGAQGTTVISNSAVTSKLLTGYVSGAGTVAATDTILQAIQKLNGNIAANGNGTVTSVSTAAANNGVTATWSMASPTPALTIGLGNITPLSVNGLTLTSAADGFTVTGGTTARTLTVTGGNASISGTHTGTSSGTNTGDQTTITGNAGSATYASAVTLTADNSTNATNYPLFTNAATGNLSPHTDTGFTYNPSTGILTATGFSGSGASLTNLTAGNLSGTIPSTVLANSTVYIGTTGITLNRASGVQALTGISSIDGSAATLTTTRTLWGQNFNGSANVTGDLTNVGNITGSSAITMTAGGTNQNITLTPSGTGYTALSSNVSLAASSYINYGTTMGETGYGIRDFGGILQFKNSSGTWTTLGSGGSTTFTGLTDTPASLSANRIMYTNATATALTDNANFTYDGTNLAIGGSIKLGADSATCNSTKEGAMRYNSTAKNMEVCDGTAWSEIGSDSILAGSQTKMLDTTALLYTSGVMAQDTDTGWNTINVASHTGTDTAQFAIVSVLIYGQATDAVANYRTNYVHFRKTGNTDPQVIAQYSWGDNTTTGNYGGGSRTQYIIPLNASEQFDYRWVALLNFSNSASIYLEGYITNEIGGDILAKLWDTDTDTGIQVEKTADDDTIRFDTAGTERMVLTSTGLLGLGTATPSSLFDLQKNGTAKANMDMLELTNSGNAADMDATQTSILFNQYYYDATTPAAASAARITVGTEQDWTSTATTRDSYMAFNTALDGTVSEKMRITSGGSVGIGVGSPIGRFHLWPIGNLNNGGSLDYAQSAINIGNYNGTTGTSLVFDTDQIELADNGSAILHINYNSPADVYMVNGGGNVRIGTPNSTTKLNVGGGIYQNVGGNYDVWLQGGATTAGGDSRNLAILGTSQTNGDKLYINYMAEYTGGLSVGGVYGRTTASAANVYIATDGILMRSTSSARYKDDIQYDIDGDLLYGLKPASYKDKNSGKEYIGFVAEDVALVEPRLAEFDEEGRPDALHYGNFASLITKTVQDQKLLIDVNTNDLTTKATATSLTDLQNMTDEQFAQTGEILKQVQDDMLVLQEDVNAQSDILAEIQTNMDSLQAGVSMLKTLGTTDALKFADLLAIDPQALVYVTNGTATVTGDLQVTNDLSVTNDVTIGNILTTKKLVAVEVETQKLTIKDDVTVTDDDEEDVNAASVGTATIDAQETEVVVETTAITEDSRVFVTMRGDKAVDVTLTVTDVQNGMCTVRIPEAKDEDVVFDWFVVGGK